MSVEVYEEREAMRLVGEALTFIEARWDWPEVTKKLRWAMNWIIHDLKISERELLESWVHKENHVGHKRTIHDMR